MLFRTVYGPELEAIYQFIVISNASGSNPKRADIYAAFVPQSSSSKQTSTQNVDDALAFLGSAHLIEERDGFRATAESKAPFQITLLGAIRRIEAGVEKPEHPIDPLFTLLLSELFIRPDVLFVQDVHAEANRLRAIREVGGLTKEKIQAWKRVMEFLGVGRRFASGFLCAYMPDLVLAILEQWGSARGTLQTFFSDHFEQILPYAQSNGELARAVMAPLTYLAEQGRIELYALQDSPSRPYSFGTSRYRGIARRRDD